jgi:hypothetical protein
VSPAERREPSRQAETWQIPIGREAPIMRTSTSTSRTSRRTTGARLASIAAVGVVLALAPIAMAGPSRCADPPRHDRVAHVHDGIEGRYGRGYRRGHGPRAGTLIIDGYRYRVCASSPHKRAARAFRRAGYDASVKRCGGRRYVHAYGRPCVRWRGDLYSGSFRAGKHCGQLRLAYRRGGRCR